VLHYSSDDSHAYGGWNQAAPFQPESWGATLRPGPGFDSNSFDKISEAELEEQGGYLVRLVGIGDRQRVRRTFEMKQAGEVSVYAVGEGTGRDMADYGYIVESGTDRVVWEMVYDRTRHAGGAEKNRAINERLQLEPGSYEAIYVTDGSHSFGSWNARRPRDPMSWGITVRP